MARRGKGFIGNKAGLRAGPQRARGGRVDSLTPPLRAALSAGQKQAKSGDHAGAIAAFADVAAKLQNAGLNFPAGRLQLRAADLTLHGAGDAAAAQTAARTALDYLLEANRPRKAGKVFAAFLEALRASDAEGADALASEVVDRLGLERLPTSEEGPELNRQQRRTLPKACACCGTAVGTSSLDWDEQAPSCGYCGNELA